MRLLVLFLMLQQKRHWPYSSYGVDVGLAVVATRNSSGKCSGTGDKSVVAKHHLSAIVLDISLEMVYLVWTETLVYAYSSQSFKTEVPLFVLLWAIVGVEMLMLMMMGLVSSWSASIMVCPFFNRLRLSGFRTWQQAEEHNNNNKRVILHLSLTSPEEQCIDPAL